MDEFERILWRIPEKEKDEMLTLILAFNYSHAGVCARAMGLKRNEWKYMMHFNDLSQYRPSEHTRVVAYGTEPNSMRLYARNRGFEIIDFQEAK